MGQTIFEKGKKVTVEGRETYLTTRKFSQDKFCPEVDIAFSWGKAMYPETIYPCGFSWPFPSNLFRLYRQGLCLIHLCISKIKHEAYL